MYGYIYKTTNKVTNKIYIGQKKSHVFLNESYLGSGKYLKRAIEKYGKNNFTIEMIDTAESRDELSKLEIYYIEKYNATNHTIGYNIAKGGIGGGETYVHNDTENEFIALSELDYYLNNGYKIGMLPGRKEINKSKTRSKNISKSLTGKLHTKEHTMRQSKSHKDSNYHWYTNGVENMDLYLGDDDVIPEGYTRGRTISKEIKSRCGLKNIGRKAWNKGLTKETDERVAKYSQTIKESLNKTKQKEG